MITDYTSTTTDPRNYEGLCSEDRAAHYRAANQSVAKRIGDMAENFILKVLASKGYNVRKSTAEEDVRLHADLILDDGVTIDVKTKQNSIWNSRIGGVAKDGCSQEQTTSFRCSTTVIIGRRMRYTFTIAARWSNIIKRIVQYSK